MESKTSAHFKLNTFIHEIDFNFSFTLSCGEITILQGRSGKGKSTIARWMTGLFDRPLGLVTIEDLAFENESSNFFIPAHKRSIAYSFQDSVLLPHLTVRENLEYAKKRRLHNSVLSDSEIVQLFGVEELFKKYSHELSGGQKQRVSLARCFFSSPKLLILDEPFSALDFETKEELFPIFLNLKKVFNIPILLITHSREEANFLGDRFLYLNEGKIEVRSGLTS